MNAMIFTELFVIRFLVILQKNFERYTLIRLHQKPNIFPPPTRGFQFFLFVFVFLFLFHFLTQEILE